MKLAAVALTAPLLAAPNAPLAAEDSRPNILFVFTDDHAAHAISAYGSRINRTPNIDRLANEGLRFANAFVGNSICAPARATVLTGLHSHANGVRDNAASFDGAQWTFPKALQAAGYETAIVGKWHLKSDPTGFDHWEVLHGQGPYYNPPLLTADGRVEHTGYTTEVITDRALSWLAGRLDEEGGSDRPFMLMYQHKAPHRSWEPGPDYHDHYTDTSIPEPPTLFDDGATRTSAFGAQEMTVREHLYDFDLKFTTPKRLNAEQRAAWEAAYGPRNAAFEAAQLEGDALVRWKYQRYLKDYLRCIDAVDDQLGRVLDWLDANGLAENTVVVYASDQGFYLGDHGWYDKRWMYEESLRMPLIVRWPAGIDAGQVDEHLVQNVDLAATFCELAGAEAAPGRHGQSLVPLLSGVAPEDWRSSIYYHYFEFPGVHAVARHYGVRTERHKLIRFYQNGEWELYDLERDPHELNNVADDPGYAEVRAELAAELERLRGEFGDGEAEGALNEE